jgi:hypothetical protein
MSSKSGWLVLQRRFKQTICLDSIWPTSWSAYQRFRLDAWRYWLSSFFARRILVGFRLHVCGCTSFSCWLSPCPPCDLRLFVSSSALYGLTMIQLLHGSGPTLQLLRNGCGVVWFRVCPREGRMRKLSAGFTRWTTLSA